MTKTKYGIISDIHENVGAVPIAIDVLKQNGAENVLVNGDVADKQKTLKESQNHIAFVLDSLGKSGLESFVQPGSHESLFSFSPVIDYFADKYDNLINVERISHVKQNGHQLIFLPGSDWPCKGGEYHIGNHKEIPSARYIQTEKGLVQFDEIEQYVNAINKGIAEGAIQYANISEIKELVDEPDKAIVVCHIPRKFNGLENCVDVAEFGEAQENFKLDDNDVEKYSVFPLPVAQQIVKIGAPVKIKKENRGNKDLTNLYDEIGIKKAVSGHFHESGHRANNRKGDYVQEGKFTDELFWNSGDFTKGQIGVLEVEDNKVAYHNINLQDYIRK